MDVILDLMVHDFDLVLNLVGRMPEDVTAMGLATAIPFNFLLAGSEIPGAARADARAESPGC